MSPRSANHMDRALGLAYAQLGLVWPNPSVGCVLVKDGRIISEGATAAGGRPHAESIAILNAKEDTTNATAYVSLEPCCHWGKTPPCTRALVNAKISRVVVAVLDPDPRVSGQGVRALREASIEVDLGLSEARAREINVGFFHRMSTGRPWVTVVGGNAHLEDHVATQDAVLSSRSSGLFISFEYHRRSRSEFHTTDWYLCTPEVNKAGLASLGGTELMIVDSDAKGHVDLKQALRALGHRGLTRVLVDAEDAIAPVFEDLELFQAKVG